MFNLVLYLCHFNRFYMSVSKSERLLFCGWSQNKRTAIGKWELANASDWFSSRPSTTSKWGSLLQFYHKRNTRLLCSQSKKYHIQVCWISVKYCYEAVPPENRGRDFCQFLGKWQFFLILAIWQLLLFFLQFLMSFVQFFAIFKVFCAILMLFRASSR